MNFLLIFVDVCLAPLHNCLTYGEINSWKCSIVEIVGIPVLKLTSLSLFISCSNMGNFHLHKSSFFGKHTIRFFRKQLVCVLLIVIIKGYLY